MIEILFKPSTFFVKRSRITIYTIFFFSFFVKIKAQNLVKNGGFASNLNNWVVNSYDCPSANSPTFTFYDASPIAGYPTLWNGSSFFKNKVASMPLMPAKISQNILGLVPASGNKVEISMDVIIGEANNWNATNTNPAQYLDDNLVLEVWLGGVLYASVRTPTGWNSLLGDEFGKCIVSYYNDATSVNYNGGNSMSNISNTYMAGQAPYLYPVKNSNWDISIPWECDKSSSALFEIRVNSSLYLSKMITDTRSQTYPQTCETNIYSNLDDIAIDNVLIKNKTIPNTPNLLISNLTSSTCHQSIFNLLPCTNALPSCPTADQSSIEYKFFRNSNLTNEILDPQNYETSSSMETVWVVLANKVTDPSLRIFSSIKRELKITRNEINTAGLLEQPTNSEICSNTMAPEIVGIINPIGVTGAELTYFWEKANAMEGPYTAASGINTAINYSPNSLTTSNEFVTNYYFIRKTSTTLNGLTCTSATSPVVIYVKPCAPISNNSNIEYFQNPGGLNTALVPNSNFSATALLGTITNIKLTTFPKKATSFTITPTSSGGRVASGTTYCGVPAAPGCIGTPFPTGGIILPTNTSGNVINNTLVVDPLDGSIQVEFPYISYDSRGFYSTDAQVALLFGISTPLAVKLDRFSIEKIGNQTVSLTWKTSDEKHFSHFEIEATRNNFKFERLQNITPNETKKYQTNIADLATGQWYFRLKMIDLDGSFNFSPIKTIELGNEINTVLVKNNPSHDFVKLDLSLKTDIYFFSLYDNTGKIILNSERNISSYESDFQLNNHRLVAGVYFLNIVNSKYEKISSKKIIIN